MSDDKDKSPDVDAAYASQTPADNVELYAKWASTYDNVFVAESGYILHRNVAEIFLRECEGFSGAVLDIGCGTGVVGVVLKAAGVKDIDGIDISAPMLLQAKAKTDVTGAPIYHHLIAADLTQRIDIADDRYGGLISSGTFTHGHVGPEAFDELWRVAAPGAECAISVRDTHFDALGFRRKLALDVERGVITQPALIETPVYSSAAKGSAHADDRCLVIICRVN